LQIQFSLTGAAGVDDRPTNEAKKQRPEIDRDTEGRGSFQ